MESRLEKLNSVRRSGKFKNSLLCWYCLPGFRRTSRLESVKNDIRVGQIHSYQPKWRPLHHFSESRVPAPSFIQRQALKKVRNFKVLLGTLLMSISSTNRLQRTKTWPHISNSIVLNYGKALESVDDTGSLVSEWYRTSHTENVHFTVKFGCTLMTSVWWKHRLQRTKDLTPHIELNHLDLYGCPWIILLGHNTRLWVLEAAGLAKGTFLCIILQRLFPSWFLLGINRKGAKPDSR